MLARTKVEEFLPTLWANLPRERKEAAGFAPGGPKSREETPKEGIGDDKVTAHDQNRCAVHKKQVVLM
jgi:hypothetical protein